MRDTSMRDTPVRDTPMRLAPLRDTCEMAYKRCTPMGDVRL